MMRSRRKESAREGMFILITLMDDDFYDLPRKEQILELLIDMEGLKVTQTSIAEVMDVSNGW